MASTPRTLHKPATVEELELYNQMHQTFTTECNYPHLAGSIPTPGYLLRGQGEFLGAIGFRDFVARLPGNEKRLVILIEWIWIRTRARRQGLFTQAVAEINRMYPDKLCVVSDPRTPEMQSWCNRHERPIEPAA